MRRRIVSVFVAILLLVSMTTTALAGGSTYHNKILTRMLFSSGQCQSTNQANAELYIDMLQNAVYLAIDQSGNKTGDQRQIRDREPLGLQQEDKDSSGACQCRQPNPEKHLHR